MNQFIFVRHGQSQANETGIIANKSSPLTDDGIKQASKVADEIRQCSISLILSSPYLRAQQTAEIIAGKLGLDVSHIKIIDELRERGLGVLVNSPKTHDNAWYFTDDDSEDIELRDALYQRMGRCLEQIKQASTSDNVLAVGHAISGFYLLQIAAGRSSVQAFDSLTQMNNGDYTVVDYTKKRP